MDAPRNFYNIKPFLPDVPSFDSLGILRMYIKKKERGKKEAREKKKVLFIDIKYLSKQRNCLFIYDYRTRVSSRLYFTHVYPHVHPPYFFILSFLREN